MHITTKTPTTMVTHTFRAKELSELLDKVIDDYHGYAAACAAYDAAYSWQAYAYDDLGDLKAQCDLYEIAAANGGRINLQLSERLGGMVCAALEIPYGRIEVSTLI